ncbi:phytoene desaturase family protein [Erwinia sorbitola]|uniref:NAD(P)-binding protein n=1 Tax=Erwinia sorbitola TaxID=2681984 RepID=A0ABW9R9U2_9GAMM|nr:FAD-dependent oxidoreductase [Erwinia sorbitola]MTD26912.1 NAD(P)-binding protein [Erwinia sorbitola]
MMKNKPTAVVIGAGASGMASALLLAMHGYEVSLVERAKKTGVTMRGFLKSRIYFDSGVHFVGELSPHGVLSAYLRYLGLESLQCLDFDQDNFETVRFSDGRQYALSVGFEAMVASLCADFPGEKVGICGYMAEVRAAYNASTFHSLQGPLSNPQENQQRWQYSLQAVIAHFTSNPYLQTLLAVPCLYHGVSPCKVSFLQHARVAGSHFNGVRTFSQGGASLVRSFEQRLREENVSLSCGNSVTKIHCDADGTLKNVELDNGECLPGSVVIYTGHPHYLPDMLPENALRPASCRRLHQLYDGMSAHLLYLTGDRHPPALLDKKNLLYCRHDRPLEQAFMPRHNGNEGPFYVMPGPSVLGNSGAHESVDYVAVIPCDATEYHAFYGSGVGKRPAAYRQQKKRRLAELAASMHRALPELATLRMVDGATPLTLQKYLNTPHAGMYGAAHDMTQFNPQPTTRLPGLYLAGQAVTGPGILGAVISAFLACGYPLGHQNLLDGVRICR